MQSSPPPDPEEEDGQGTLRRHNGKAWFVRLLLVVSERRAEKVKGKSIFSKQNA